MRIHVEHVSSPIIDKRVDNDNYGSVPYAVLTRDDVSRPWFTAVSPLDISGCGSVTLSTVSTKFARIPLFAYNTADDPVAQLTACLRIGVRISEQLGANRVETLFIVLAKQPTTPAGPGGLLVGFAFRI